MLNNGVPLAMTDGANDVNKLPFTTRAIVCASNVTTGAKLSMNYSAKRFEGTKAPVGQEEYTGNFKTGDQPSEVTNFIFGVCNAKGDAAPNVHINSGGNDQAGPTAAYTSDLLIQVKVEYIVVLTEPRMDQGLGEVQAATAMAM